ncbi:YciI family protein [Microbacterium sp. NPDC057659]|uniref:YciI family protein n=1 Tax=unclassified Microbacterium TaxID=2609290 RepID=UPI00366CF9A1
MPQFAVLIHVSDSAHAPDATPEELKECDDDYEALVASGRMSLAYALTPKEFAKTVRRTGDVEGVHRPDGDIVAGFYVIEAADIDEAARLARHNPAVLAGGAVEIRPVHSGGLVEVS